MVALLIPQEYASYRMNLEIITPDYVVFGDDWMHSGLRKYREEVIESSKKWDLEDESMTLSQTARAYEMNYVGFEGDFMIYPEKAAEFDTFKVTNTGEIASSTINNFLETT